MTNTDIALSLINLFATGETKIAEAHLAKDYIQHNLNFGTGRDQFIEAVTGLQQAPTKTTVETIRSFSDGPYVVLHSRYNFAGAGDQIGIDVFRFEDNMIAEHWDNLSKLTGPTPSGHTQYDGTTKISDLDNTASNKQLVANFVRDVLRGENPSALPTYFDGDHYIQHNSGIADGLSGLSTALSAMAEQDITMTYDRTFRVLGHGNFVLAMSEGTFGVDHVAFYDLFSVLDGKIAEHWDIIETIPEKTTWANQNGKF
ncbi:nuclear transport factor 2 family protein [Furfurilactobacillus sp. WILCCON 0119]